MIPDDPDGLEARLRALRPVGLPPELRARLLNVEPPPVRHRLLRFLPLAGSLTAGTAIVVMTALSMARHHAPPARAGGARASAGPLTPPEYRVYVPTDQRSTLLGVSEGAIVDDGARAPVRLVRAVWLDDTTYVGSDHSTVHRRTTRTEVIPVSLESL